MSISHLSVRKISRLSGQANCTYDNVIHRYSETGDIPCIYFCSVALLVEISPDIISLLTYFLFFPLSPSSRNSFYPYIY